MPNQLHQQLGYKHVKESSLTSTEVFSVSFPVPGISNCSLLGLYFLTGVRDSFQGILSFDVTFCFFSSDVLS